MLTPQDGDNNEQDETDYGDQCDNEAAHGTPFC